MSLQTRAAAPPAPAVESNQTAVARRSPKHTLIVLSDDERKSLDRIEEVIESSELAANEAGGKVTRAFAMAQGIAALRMLITDQMMLKHIMPLMNTRLGFRTDRDPTRPSYGKAPPEPYPLAVVKDCVIEALLRGANVVGNEFNIISSQSYFTREFFERALGELPAVTNVVASPGIPRFETGPDGKIIKALIRFGLSWKVNGNADCLRDAEGKPGRVFEIRADNWSSADQMIGKATRKAYAAAYKQVIGSELVPQEGDITDVVEGAVVGDPDSQAPPANDATKGSRSAALVKDLKQRQQGKGALPPQKDLSEEEALAELQRVNDQKKSSTNVSPPKDAAAAPPAPNGNSNPAGGVAQAGPEPASAGGGGVNAGQPARPDVSSYDSFRNFINGLAQDRGVMPEQCEKCVHAFLVTAGKVGKPDKTTREQRQAAAGDAIAGRGDFAAFAIDARGEQQQE